MRRSRSGGLASQDKNKRDDDDLEYVLGRRKQRGGASVGDGVSTRFEKVAPYFGEVEEWTLLGARFCNIFYFFFGKYLLLRITSVSRECEAVEPLTTTTQLHGRT